MGHIKVEIKYRPNTKKYTWDIELPSKEYTRKELAEIAAQKVVRDMRLTSGSSKIKAILWFNHRIEKEIKI